MPDLNNVKNLGLRGAIRPAHLGCFGLHEWAMVYRQTQEELRHNAWPLRLGPHGTERLAPGVVTPALNGVNIHDTGAVSAALRSAFEKLGTRPRRIAP